MYTVNYRSSDRQRRLAMRANAIKEERKLKNFLFDAHITFRIANAVQEANRSMGIL